MEQSRSTEANDTDVNELRVWSWSDDQIEGAASRLSNRLDEVAFSGMVESNELRLVRDPDWSEWLVLWSLEKDGPVMP